MPCQIDPSASEGSVGSKLAAVGAGNAAFCVVTVAQGKTANIVAFDGSGGNNEAPPKESSPAPQPTTTQQPTTSQTPTSTSTPQPTTTSVAPTTSSEPTSTYVPTTTSSSTRPALLPGIFHENGTTSDNSTTTAVSSTALPVETTAPNAPKPTEKKGEAGRQQGSAAVAGLVVAFIAAACLF